MITYLFMLFLAPASVVVSGSVMKDPTTMELAAPTLVAILVPEVFGVLPAMRAFEKYIGSFYMMKKHRSRVAWENTGFEVEPQGLFGKLALGFLMATDHLGTTQPHNGTWRVVWFGNPVLFKPGFWATLEILVGAHLLWVNEECHKRGWTKLRMTSLDSTKDGIWKYEVRLKKEKKSGFINKDRHDGPGGPWRYAI